MVQGYTGPREEPDLPRTAPTTDLARAIEILNTWDTLEPQPELIVDAAILRRFVRWIGHPELEQRVTDADLPRFRALRSQLRLAFAAPSEVAAVAALNGVLAANPSIAQLAADNGGWTFRHLAANPSDVIAALAAEAAVALLIAIRDRGWDRLGICAAAPCTCVYVDRTKNRSRRYCSDLCNDRISQLAHRRRRRAAGTSTFSRPDSRRAGETRDSRGRCVRPNQEKAGEQGEHTGGR